MLPHMDTHHEPKQAALTDCPSLPGWEPGSSSQRGTGPGGQSAILLCQGWGHTLALLAHSCHLHTH